MMPARLRGLSPTGRRPDFESVNRAALANLPALLRRWLPDGRLVGNEYQARNPKRLDRRPGSFRINVRTGRWADFAVDAKGGDVISLAAYLSGTGQTEAARNVAAMLGWAMSEMARMFEALTSEEPAAETVRQGTPKKRPIVPVPDDAPPMQYRHPELGDPTDTWEYRDADGTLVGYVCRWDGSPGKEIRPIAFCELNDGRQEWCLSGFPAPRPLYRLPEIIERRDATVLVVEGEKTADAAARLFANVVATTPAHGAQSPHKTDWSPLHGRHVIVWGDKDAAGRKYAETVACLSKDSGAASVAIVEVPSDFPEKWDLADTPPGDLTVGRLRELLDTAVPWTNRDQMALRAVNIGEFLCMKILPREMLLAPVVPSQGLVLLYAIRGVGKTFVGLSIAYAVATGGKVLRWQAPTPRKVLYVDGEMPATTMQERIAQIIEGSEKEPPDHDHLRIITPDLNPDGIPDLCTEEGQAAIEKNLEGVSLVIFDNLSTLCRYGRENEAESWEPMQQWLLSLRRRGIAVLVIHHAGKGGSQRGTSKREDCLDTVICLKRPPDYRPEDGARFEIHLEKARGLIGEDAKPFEARLEVRDNAAVWTTRDIEDRELAIVIERTQAGDSVRDIAEETGISKSKVNRLQRRAREDGRLDK